MRGGADVLQISSGAVASAPVTASSFGSEGVTVAGVTFSAPTYSVALHGGSSGGSKAAPLLVAVAAAFLS